MRRVQGYYSYTIVSGGMKKNVTYLLVPPLPEEIRHMMVHRVLKEDETVIFIRKADGLKTYREGDFKIEVLSY